VAVQAEKRVMTPAQYADVKQYYEAWDKVYIATTLADGAVGLYQIGKNWQEFYTLTSRAGGSLKTSLKTAATTFGDFSKWGKIVTNVGNLFEKFDNLGLSVLKNEINLLDDVSKAKFLNEFAGSSDDVLRAMDRNTSLVDYWKTNGDFIKNKIYPNAGHKLWDDTKNTIITKADPTEIKILNAIENAPQPSNSQVAIAGAYSPELGGNVELKYNDKNFNVDLLEPELKQHLDYLGMIKQDFDKGGDLYQKLYSNVPIEKMQNAGEVGKHAEVLAPNEVIKQLKLAGKFNGIQDLNKVYVLVKGRAAFGNKCRCPHCFQILDGVKMIGNK